MFHGPNQIKRAEQLCCAMTMCVRWKTRCAACWPTSPTRQPIRSSRVQLLQGGVSECCNKSLQLKFHLMGGGDKAGSGMDKIRAGWRSQHWRSPRLEESLQPDRVKLVLPEDSPQLPPNSPQLDRLAGLLPEIQALLPLAEAARKNKNLPRDQLKGIVLKLCASRWLAASELAALVDRDSEKLQSRFLTAMVREGLLELRHPEVRNRPDQAYRTVVKAPH